MEMQASVAKEYSKGNSHIESVAYDLSRFDNRRRVREALENEPSVSTHGDARARTRAKVGTAAAAQTAARPRRMKLSAFAVLSYVAIFALLMMIVMNYMRLNEISVIAAAKASELEELKNQTALLKVEYEQKQNVDDIKSRAAELGLYAPTSAQINYIDLSKPDYAVIYEQENESDSFVSGISRIVAIIGNFFE